MSVIKIKETREFGKFALLFSNFHLILLLARVVMGKGGAETEILRQQGHKMLALNSC